MVQELSVIREQLFDAPAEVKQAFNEVVGYFDGKGFGKGNLSNSKHHCAVGTPSYDRESPNTNKPWNWEIKNMTAKEAKDADHSPFRENRKFIDLD